MASTPSKTEATPEWNGPRVDFARFAAALAERRATLGEIPAPRNAGDRRTESKTALLKAIEDLGGEW